MNQEILDREVRFCEWFQYKVHEVVEFVSKLVLSNEATFRLNRKTPQLSVLSSRKSTHSCAQSDHFTRNKSLVWKVIQIFNWSVLFEGTVSDLKYLDTFRTTISLAALWEYKMAHHHRDIRSYYISMNIYQVSGRVKTYC